MRTAIIPSAPLSHWEKPSTGFISGEKCSQLALSISRKPSCSLAGRPSSNCALNKTLHPGAFCPKMAAISAASLASIRRERQSCTSSSILRICSLALLSLAP
ncbi:unknown [Clostridium sp. CAG:226]|nr:unknown [Clostridium sp. CAG:226]